MKICKKCRTERPLTAYYKSTQNRSGYLNTCIPCARAYAKEKSQKETTKNKANPYLKSVSFNPYVGPEKKGGAS